MSGMRRWWSAAILVLVAQAGAATPKTTVAAERPAAIDALLDGYVERREVAGGAALIVRDGRTVYERYFGMADIEAGEPVTEQTIYRIASMTKPIVSVAVMMLVEEGKLSVDDPVSRFIPEFADAKVLVERDDGGHETAPAQQPITIHHLLTHTSGITYRFMGREPLADLYAEANISDGLVQTEGTIGQMARRLADLPLLHQPGSAWEYGLSVDVLGRVVEVVSGQNLAEFCRRRIFGPLGMTDTHFFLPADKTDRLAALYQPAEGDGLERTGPAPVRTGHLVYSGSFHYQGPRTYYSGGAGLCSTIGDYARFCRMLLNGGELEGARLLRPQTVRKMASNQIGELDLWIPSHGDKFGFGFGVLTEAGADEDPASAGTYSWGGFYHTYFWIDPKQRMIGILMTQLYPNDHLSMRTDFKRAAYEAFGGGR